MAAASCTLRATPPGSSLVSRPIFGFVVAAFAVLLSLLGAEAALRVAGYRPWQRLAEFDRVPVMTQADPVLGWANKPGHYAYDVSPDAGDNHISVSIQPDGRRGAAASPADDVWVFGCSFTFGWAVTDGQEYPMQLDARLGGNRVSNFGVAGYGALQSMELFKRKLRENGGKGPPLVVYGLISFHDERNAGTTDWLRMIRAAGRGHAWVATPFVSLDGENLVRHRPDTYQVVPGSQSSSLIALAQEAFNRARSYGRENAKRAVSIALLKEWNRVATEAGSKFLVLALYLPHDRLFYLQELSKAGIAVVDGSRNDIPAPGTMVRGDENHPVPTLHAYWAGLVAEYIEKGRVWKPQNEQALLGYGNDGMRSGEVPLLPGGSVQGYVERIVAGPAGIEVEGWAVDSLKPGARVALALLVDDELVETGFSKLPRADVSEKLHLPPGTAPGFKLRVTRPFSEKASSIQLVAVKNGAATPLPCTGAGC